MCGSLQVPVGSCNKRLKFVKVIFLGFDSFKKSTYGLFEDLGVNPHHVVMWLLRKSSIVITVFVGVIEDWRREITGDDDNKKLQFLPHLRNREFFQVFPKENEARILVNILGNYYSNN